MRVTRGHFERSLLPSATVFYQHELDKISRPTQKGWAKADCPFHSSSTHKSLSINLRHGGFHCFGCGMHGDMVTFLRERYHLGFREACQSLGAWSGEMARVDHLRHERQRQERERIERHERERQLRVAAGDRLRGLEKVWEVVTRRFEDDELYYEFLTDLLVEIREAEVDYDRRIHAGWNADGLGTAAKEGEG